MSVQKDDDDPFFNEHELLEVLTPEHYDHADAPKTRKRWIQPSNVHYVLHGLAVIIIIVLLMGKSTPRQQEGQLSSAMEPCEDVQAEDSILFGSASESNFRCFYSQSKYFHCSIPEKSDHLPQLIGIGPAKTGTHTLMQWLKGHPSITFGDQGLMQSGVPSNQYEISFFTYNRFTSKGLPFYQGAFAVNATANDPQLLIESSPSYADTPMVPYIIRGMMDPPPRFFITIRDPVDALARQYYHKVRVDTDWNTTFIEWAHVQLDKHATYQECLQTKSQDVLLPMLEHTSALPEVWKSDQAQHLERYLYVECWIPMMNQRSQERMAHHDYASILKRYIRLFGADSIKCIFQEDMTDDQKRLEVLNDFMDWNGIERQADRPDAFMNEQAQMQLQDLFNATAEEDMDELNDVLEQLRKSFGRSTDMNYLRSLCAGNET